MKKVGTSIDFYHWAILIVTIGALAGPTTFVMVGLLVALLALIYHWLPGSSYDQPLSQKAGQQLYAGLLFVLGLLLFAKFAAGLFPLSSKPWC